MNDLYMLADDIGEWPPEAEKMYERVEVLGQGSYGLVWMVRRRGAAVDKYDDEYVALKNIEIKEAKGRVFAEREISILEELRHPNVIRLVRSFPVYEENFRLVALQLARGPNLNALLQKRGALGLPLARLVSRQLIAAVSYLHGRAVLHRDIKPTNCILENTQLKPTELYDWLDDDSIWSDGDDAVEAVRANKWKLMLIDFGFARALDESEIKEQPRRMRNSIVNEKGAAGIVGESGRSAIEAAAAQALEELARSSILSIDEAEPAMAALADIPEVRMSAVSTVDHSENAESKKTDPSENAYGYDTSMRGKNDETHSDKDKDEDEPRGLPNGTIEGAMPDVEHFGGVKKRVSLVSNQLPRKEPSADGKEATKDTTKQKSKRKDSSKAKSERRPRRTSTARTKLRSMSALGTKAYAAPEIKDRLRRKNAADYEKMNAALTDCVADYGMIVDAYSVGWTLRVVLTGVPPQSTISQYMEKVEKMKEDQVSSITVCCCFQRDVSMPDIIIRDTPNLPKDATLLVRSLTKINPEERMTVREAQNHPWIRGTGDDVYDIPQGDYPSRHGDPVVPLKCARELYKIAEAHHDS